MEVKKYCPRKQMQAVLRLPRSSTFGVLRGAVVAA
jgi:hypothetical protein